MRTYTDAALHFSLAYPSDLKVYEYDEGGSTKSVVFQKPNEHVGFQIYLAPDPVASITLAGIESEFPTLKMQGVKSVTIGTGTPALAFASDAPNFGPSQELWFVHDGYLFEIATYPDRAQWLKKIIDTIRFP